MQFQQTRNNRKKGEIRRKESSSCESQRQIAVKKETCYNCIKFQKHYEQQRQKIYLRPRKIHEKVFAIYPEKRKISTSTLDDSQKFTRILKVHYFFLDHWFARNFLQNFFIRIRWSLKFWGLSDEQKSECIRAVYQTKLVQDQNAIRKTSMMNDASWSHFS